MRRDEQAKENKSVRMERGKMIGKGKKENEKGRKFRGEWKLKKRREEIKKGKQIREKIRKKERREMNKKTKIKNQLNILCIILFIITYIHSIKISLYI